MDALHILLPIAVGAVIGYCTNYIAIKMLFRPRKELRIGTWRVPFTPGVIPKNQPRIAAAVGRAVSESLLTEEDLAAGFSGEGLKTALADRLEGFLQEERTPLGGMLVHADLDREELTDKVSRTLGDKILEGVGKMDMESVVGEIARTSFADLLSNPMIAMFLGGGMLDAIIQKLGSAVTDYARDRGPEVVTPMVREELESILDKPLGENLADLEIPPEALRGLLETLVDKLLADSLQPLLAGLDVKAMVEEKVNAMDARELEDLVLSVMKNELQAIVNLGALIGAVIGIVNIFI